MERGGNHTREATCYRPLGEITANDFPVAIGVYRLSNVPRAPHLSSIYAARRISTGGGVNRAVLAASFNHPVRLSSR